VSTTVAPRSMRVAAAPVSWGVSELTALPAHLTADLVLDQMAVAGYEGTELGPPGFLGDGAAARARLRSHGLELVGAFLPQRFSREENRDEDLGWLARTLELMDEATPGVVRPKAVLADASVEPARLAFAGRIEAHPETWLSAARRELLVGGIQRAAELCQRRGFDAVLHPHAGSFIETDAEIRFVLERVDPALVGFCLDTGHVAFGGADPVALAREYGGLIRHVHLKDLDRRALSAALGDGADMAALWRRGIWVELGTGDAAIGDVVTTLREGGYRDWLVVEQDRVLVEADGARPLAAQRRNRRFLGSLGLAP
jgi:inosose dehydratase